MRPILLVLAGMGPVESGQLNQADFQRDASKRAIDKEVDMIEPFKSDPSTSELAALLRFQHDALQELIDIALTAVRESGDSSVAAMRQRCCRA